MRYNCHQCEYEAEDTLINEIEINLPLSLGNSNAINVTCNYKGKVIPTSTDNVLIKSQNMTVFTVNANLHLGSGHGPYTLCFGF